MTTAYKLTPEKCEEVGEKAARQLYEYCWKNKLHFVVYGSSGGKDSALTAAYAGRAEKMAAADGYLLKAVGITIPIDSDPKAERLGREVIETFGADHIHQDMTNLFNLATGRFDWNTVFDGISIDSKDMGEIIHRIDANVVSNVDRQVMQILKKYNRYNETKWSYAARVAQGNIKARMRMAFAVYHIARMLNGEALVLSTDNLSEYFMSFWTLHGDVGDFSMIQFVWKGLEIIDLCRHEGVPQEVIDDMPDDGNKVAGGGDAGGADRG